MPRTEGQAMNQETASGGFRRFWRALRQLFHEMIGAIFALLAVIWFQNSFRAWLRDVPRWVVGLAAATAMLMLFFAWTSFRKARQLR